MSIKRSELSSREGEKIMRTGGKTGGITDKTIDEKIEGMIKKIGEMTEHLIKNNTVQGNLKEKTIKEGKIHKIEEEGTIVTISRKNSKEEEAKNPKKEEDLQLSLPSKLSEQRRKSVILTRRSGRKQRLAKSERNKNRAKTIVVASHQRVRNLARREEKQKDQGYHLQNTTFQRDPSRHQRKKPKERRKNPKNRPLKSHNRRSLKNLCIIKGSLSTQEPQAKSAGSQNSQ